MCRLLWWAVESTIHFSSWYTGSIDQFIGPAGYSCRSIERCKYSIHPRFTCKRASLSRRSIEKKLFMHVKLVKPCKNAINSQLGMHEHHIMPPAISICIVCIHSWPHGLREGKEEYNLSSRNPREERFVDVRILTFFSSSQKRGAQVGTMKLPHAPLLSWILQRLWLGQINGIAFRASLVQTKQGRKT